MTTTSKYDWNTSAAYGPVLDLDVKPTRRVTLFDPRKGLELPNGKVWLDKNTLDILVGTVAGALRLDDENYVISFGLRREPYYPLEPVMFQIFSEHWHNGNMGTFTNSPTSPYVSDAEVDHIVHATLAARAALVERTIAQFERQ